MNLDKDTLLYLVACDSIIVDDITKKPGYIGIFDLLVIPPKQEKLLYSFNIGGKIFTPKDGEMEVKINIIGPDGKVFKSTTTKSVVQKGDVDMRFGFHIVEFTLAGKYILKALINGVEADDGDRYYFDVVKL